MSRSLTTLGRLSDRETNSPNFIPFNVATLTGRESAYLAQVAVGRRFAGGGPFSDACRDWLVNHFGKPVLPTTSCSHALEMAAMLCDLKPGDEVILPSYAFSSTGAAFARCGASLVFVDIDPATMNVDPGAVEAAVTARTRVIVCLHYGGIACPMEALVRLAKERKLLLVEDAAQGMFARYQGQLCGTFGMLGCVSFHETKNLHCGEGGALIVNEPHLLDRAETIMEKGTDRRRFLRGEVGKYRWQEIGSSYVLSELNCAFLLAQLEGGEEITRRRVEAWQRYRESLQALSETRKIEMSEVPPGCEHNGHTLWVKTKDESERLALMTSLRRKEIQAAFHYLPLHSSPAGLRYGRMAGVNRYTTLHSGRLLRLPLFDRFDQTDRVVEALTSFYDC